MSGSRENIRPSKQMFINEDSLNFNKAQENEEEMISYDEAVKQLKHEQKVQEEDDDDEGGIRNKKEINRPINAHFFKYIEKKIEEIEKNKYKNSKERVHDFLQNLFDDEYEYCASIKKLPK